jgi:protein-tyrosine-phosphatase
MHEFISEDLAMACYSAGLLDAPGGRHTSRMAEIIESSGPIIETCDQTDPALITELRLAAGDLVETLSDEQIGELIPYLRREYAKQKMPDAPQ